MEEARLTTREIYNLAYERLLDLWNMEHEKQEKFIREYGRENKITKAWEERRWKELQILCKMMNEL